MMPLPEFTDAIARAFHRAFGIPAPQQRKPKNHKDN